MLILHLMSHYTGFAVIMLVRSHCSALASFEVKTPAGFVGCGLMGEHSTPTLSFAQDTSNILKLYHKGTNKAKVQLRLNNSYLTQNYEQKSRAYSHYI